MDEIDPLIFTTTATAAVVSVAARPHPISHLLIGRLRVRRARVCWYILIDVRWRRLIWQQPAGGSEGEAGGVSDLQLASFDPVNLCPGKHFNPIKAIVWKPPYKHCNYANYIKLQICANARTHTVSQPSGGGEMIWLYGGLSLLWVWVEVSLKTEAIELKKKNANI